MMVESEHPTGLLEGDDEYVVCRVCQCAEPDRDGERALQMLGIPSDPKVLAGRGQLSSSPPVLWSTESLFHPSEGRPASQYGHEISVMLLNLQASIIHLRRQALHIGRRSDGDSLSRDPPPLPPLEALVVSSESLSESAAMPAHLQGPRMAGGEGRPPLSPMDSVVLPIAPPPGNGCPANNVTAIASASEQGTQRQTGEEIVPNIDDGSKSALHAGDSSKEAGWVASRTEVAVGDDAMVVVVDGIKEGRRGVAFGSLGKGEQHQQQQALILGSAEFLLMEIGCACKGGMALAHYACVLRWFVSRGNVRCEICGQLATGVRMDDVKAIMMAVQERRRSAAYGWEVFLHTEPPPAPGPDGGAALSGESTTSMRQKRVEAAAWFDPQFNELGRRGTSRISSSSVFGSTADSLGEALDSDADSLIVSPGVKLLLDVLAVIIASALMALTLANLFSKPMSKKMKTLGLHYIVATLVSLGIVIWFRLVILPRIRRGPTRYWAVLLFFWFLIFGIWGLGAHVSGGSNQT